MPTLSLPNPLKPAMHQAVTLGVAAALGALSGAPSLANEPVDAGHLASPISQEVVPPAADPQDALPQDSLSQETDSQESIPQEATPQGADSQESIPQETTPQEVLPLESSPQPYDPTILYEAEALTVRWHLQFGLNAVAETNLFWNFADIVAPTSGFDSDTEWLEGYAKPGISFDWQLSDDSTLYGRLSAVGSFTLGIDAYSFGNTGRITLEEGYLGYRTALGEDLNFDLSVGPRELRLGTGMLIANGGSSGFERGALKFGPRKAWEMSAIGRLSSGNVTGTWFYLNPNEVPSNNSGNQLAGADLRVDFSPDDYLGLTYLNVLTSEASYPQAAPGGVGAPSVLPGARNGLNALDIYGRITPFEGRWENLFLTGELAYEWNNRIDLQALGGRVQAGYTFAEASWSPSLMLYYQSFSGDDPNTAALERFDPLYYDGSPAAWGTGSKSSMVFINSNVQSLGLTLSAAPSPRDRITLRYARIMANQLRSPVQFGQATRVEFGSGVSNVVSGVTNAHLADDFFLEYSRILNRHTFLTTGLSVSIPGAGITSVFPGNVPLWTGGFVNVVVNF